MAKAALWVTTDAETRKLGEQTGLDTPVVLALNEEYQTRDLEFCFVANALSTPPGDYDRKVETQRN